MLLQYLETTAYTEELCSPDSLDKSSEVNFTLVSDAFHALTYVGAD